MYNGKKILCIIPARSGSKGLPNKNIKKLFGKPLIVYSIEQAKGSRYIDKVLVSTDSPRIAEIARAAGAEAPFLRPKKLATNKSSIYNILLHAMDWLEKREKYFFDITVLLHANTPLRKAEDIDNCIKLLFRKNAHNVFSVCRAQRNPYFNMVEIDKHGQPRLIRKGNFINRQDAPRVFDMNGSIYVWRNEALRKEKTAFLKRGGAIYIMPKERSVDIDDYFDFKMAEFFLGEARKEKRK